MTQTTLAISGKGLYMAWSANNSDWNDISGEAGKVETDPQTRMSGEAYTADGDTAIVTAGKREPINLKVSGVYTESATEMFEELQAYFESGSNIYFRYAPAGNVSAKSMFTTPAVPITEFVYPAADAGSGDPVAAGFTVRAPYITESTIA